MNKLAPQRRADNIPKTSTLEPPSLQALVLAYGNYSSIPAVAWKIFDERMKQWKASIRGGDRWFSTREDR